jgi:predicted nucleic acid-binding protein
MIAHAYVDSSVLLRVVMRQTDALAEWDQIKRGIVSALVPVECLRTIDRMRLQGLLTEDEVVRRREAAFRILETADIVHVTESVMARASYPLPTQVGTLDAIHLSTAMLWRETEGRELVMATHDRGLAQAARACGLTVVGSPAA